ncbi:hypothetical protein HanXRQr2_Chr05g0211631 [Helianthus annuus]|uniref:Uncharacterized protein n=1 Tax=Helianthus annuus TaxID=4232 RepID=A0A9K3IZI3_HELAN|nr:hypothetical protein HanXRQr2_Chr05g0211631 [Helianthus annuus]
MEPKKSRKQRAKIGGLCQQRMITNDVKHVVTSITAITANPAKKSNMKIENFDTMSNGSIRQVFMIKQKIKLFLKRVNWSEFAQYLINNSFKINLIYF